MPDINTISPKWAENVQKSANGVLPNLDTNSIDAQLSAWNLFSNTLNKSVTAGSIFSNPIVSTYNLVYTTTSGGYDGGVLAPNGDIHFIPLSAAVGQKISASGVVSTYSLVYTISTNAVRTRARHHT